MMDTFQESKASELEPEDTAFFCLICFSESSSQDAYQLPCGHKYCKSCIQAYIESNVIEGKTQIKCFYVGSSNSDGTKAIPCDEIIGKNVIIDLLQNNPPTLAKYTRFEFLKSNPNARECPQCSHFQIGNHQDPQMICTSCHSHYCFVHALAHPPSMTCEAYERSMSNETEVNLPPISPTICIIIFLVRILGESEPHISNQ